VRVHSARSSPLVDVRQVATEKGILTAADITKRIERLQGFGRDFVGAAIVRSTYRKFICSTGQLLR